MHEDLKRLATRDDFGYLKSDMGSLKTEVGNLKADVGSLKAELNSLKEKLVTPQQIRTIMREVLEEYRAR